VRTGVDEDIFISISPAIILLAKWPASPRCQPPCQIKTTKLPRAHLTGISKTACSSTRPPAIWSGARAAAPAVVTVPV